eukprot:PLAT2467.9.p1 GENE.PLAT2467.9~~PLAT2467.9.p1  ORF type:complete len:542 (-),score=265.93 PLAT2467.9:184-1782(-)
MRTILLLAVLAACVAASGPVVQTTQGPVQGESVDGYYRFRGIPYAASTAPPNRFLPPVERAAWTTPLDATAYGPGCEQNGNGIDNPKNQSEDCLLLNIWSSDLSGSKPVMLFIHGGGFVSGSSMGPFDIYDGSYIATRHGDRVVVVTIQYRLSAFGFLFGGEVGGNMGLLDQRMAMKWVKANIANFGGDPSQVTIWGESAGAMSVGLHMTMPASSGLFTRAIMESNPAGWEYRDASDAASYGKSFCGDVGCSGCTTSCLQKASVTDLKAAAAKVASSIEKDILDNKHIIGAALTWTPTVEDKILSKQPLTAFQNGEILNADVLIGTNQNEGVTFVYGAIKSPKAVWEYEAAINYVFGLSDGHKILERYKSQQQSDGRWDLATVMTDWLFRCPSEAMAGGAQAAGNKAYVYRFDYPLPAGQGAKLWDAYGVPECANYTCHAAELPFVFHNFGGQFPMVGPEPDISNAFVDYWTNFAVEGNPSASLSDVEINWPAFNSTTKLNIVMEAPPLGTESVIDQNDKLCDFWNAIGYFH